jgi:hypothetical protein
LNDLSYPSNQNGGQVPGWSERPLNTITAEDLSDLGAFYQALGWNSEERANFFFETASIFQLSLEELKILYLLQLRDNQKMSDPLAKLCQLDWDWGN